MITDVDQLGAPVSWTVDLTTVYATSLLTVLADTGHSVRHLSGRAVSQASAVYHGGEAKTDAKDAPVIADESRMRAGLPVLHPTDGLLRELQILTSHRTDLVADRPRIINRHQQLGAICPARTRRRGRHGPGWAVLPTRYQRPKEIRPTDTARLTRILAEAGVRHAGTIAEAAVAAAKAQTVRLPGEGVAAALVAELAQGMIDLDARITTADAALEDRFRRISSPRPA